MEYAALYANVFPTFCNVSRVQVKWPQLLLPLSSILLVYTHSSTTIRFSKELFTLIFQGVQEIIRILTRLPDFKGEKTRSVLLSDYEMLNLC